MTAVIWYESDGYRTDQARLMGRHAAGAGFLKGYVRHARADRFVALVRTDAERREFLATVRAIRPDAPATVIPAALTREIREHGVLSYPGPLPRDLAFIRDSFGPNAWSLCGVTHTIASAKAMDTIAGWLTAPLHPWDAVICTSRAVLKAVERVVEAESARLSATLGATRFTLPKLPVIPLGVDCDALAFAPGEREKARAELGIAGDETVVLFVGRLAYHAKAHPAAMYLALERAAAGRRVVLVECGWFPNDKIEAAFAEARAKLCPGVRSIVLDGRDPVLVRRAWAVGDIFCSLSDNIQETFGLAPIEAMAAGMPSVVTDWDGYRDTVRDGIDGLTVPTLAPPAGSGVDIALAHAAGINTYDTYIARASLATVVDSGAAAAALARLVAEPDLRRTMGESAALRAREVFDWKNVIRLYEELWAELDAVRRATPADGPGHTVWPASPGHPVWPASPGDPVWPARMDPFDVFSGYPTRTLDTAQLIRLDPAADTAAFATRLELGMAQLGSFEGFSVVEMTKFRDSLRGTGLTVGAWLRQQPQRQRGRAARALLLMAKFGLAEISDPP